MHDIFEFFAVFTSSYFGVTDELGDKNSSREMIWNDFPDIFASLRDLYQYVYYARATAPGDFFVAPAHAEETYFPRCSVAATMDGSSGIGEGR